MTTRKHKTKLSAVEAVAGDRDLMKALMQEARREVLEGEMTEFLGAMPAGVDEQGVSTRKVKAINPARCGHSAIWQPGSANGRPNTPSGSTGWSRTSPRRWPSTDDRPPTPGT